jgi:hypothetical protein
MQVATADPSTQVNLDTTAPVVQQDSQRLFRLFHKVSEK